MKPGSCVFSSFILYTKMEYLGARASAYTRGLKTLKICLFGRDMFPLYLYFSFFSTHSNITIREKIITYSILKTINPVRFCVSDG